MTISLQPVEVANAIFNAHVFGQNRLISLNVNHAGLRAYGRGPYSMGVFFAGDPHSDYNATDEVFIDAEEAKALQSELRKLSKSQDYKVDLSVEDQVLYVNDGNTPVAELGTLDGLDPGETERECQMATVPAPPQSDPVAVSWHILSQLNKLKPTPAVAVMNQAPGGAVQVAVSDRAYVLLQPVKADMVSNNDLLGNHDWLDKMHEGGSLF